jgi:hypothetical protein
MRIYLKNMQVDKRRLINDRAERHNKDIQEKWFS